MQKSKVKSQNYKLKFKIIFFLLFCLLMVTSKSSCLAVEPGTVVINEAMWMGTTSSDTDEWIELRNTTSSDIDLSGWTLNAQDGTPAISLSKTISANGYFLLERTDDNTVSDVTADQFFTGALGNGGEYLLLKDNNNNPIDEINASGGWPAGDNSSAESRASMERQNGSWATNDGVIVKGKDANGNSIKGTPRSANSPGRQPTSTPTPSPTPTPEPESSPTPTPQPEADPTATPVPINTPTPKPTKKPTATPTPKSEVLGEESEIEETTFLLSELGEESEEQKKEETEKQKKGIGQWLPQIMIGGGVILIGVAAFSFVYPRLKNRLRKEGFDQETS